MSVNFENYSHSFNLKGKPVFAPSLLGRKIGQDVKRRVENAFEFAPYFFHLRNGGHVAAIHCHRPNRYFCKFDIENFFYSVARNRVTRNLREIGIPRPRHYAKWSSVKNPYRDPSYALPYGFVQSPVLATLVLARSALGQKLSELHNCLNVSVYMDDITLSSSSLHDLQAAFGEVLDAFAESNLTANKAKLVEPTEQISVFNCEIMHKRSAVLEGRIAEFFSIERNEPSVESFENYCHSVEEGND